MLIIISIFLYTFDIHLSIIRDENKNIYLSGLNQLEWYNIDHCKKLC